MYCACFVMTYVPQHNNDQSKAIFSHMMSPEVFSFCSVSAQQRSSLSPVMGHRGQAGEAGTDQELHTLLMVRDHQYPESRPGIGNLVNTAL